MRWLFFIVVTLTLVASPRVEAVQPDEILADAALEGRARALSKELRCMVCQNQSIDDSDAPLASGFRSRRRGSKAHTSRTSAAFRDPGSPRPMNRLSY